MIILSIGYRNQTIRTRVNDIRAQPILAVLPGAPADALVSWDAAGYGEVRAPGGRVLARFHVIGAPLVARTAYRCGDQRPRAGRRPRRDGAVEAELAAGDPEALTALAALDAPAADALDELEPAADDLR